MQSISKPVLVVGGGLVGLSAAVFLAWRRVPIVLVERRPGSSPHPRAIGYTPRTLELYRAVGLGPHIPQAPPSFRLRRARIESLAGKWFEEAPWTPESQQTSNIDYSPCTGAAIAQDRLEPILRRRAIELGADIRLNTELTSFKQSADSIVASLRNHDGNKYELPAAYLIGADGHRSPIRNTLGIGRSGRGHIRTVRSVLFRAPLEEYLQTGITQFTIDQPGFGAFLTTYGDGRWVLIFSDEEERDEAMLRRLVTKVIGRSDLEIAVITTGRWEISALIADSFVAGRVFLAGDAAHTLPPNRGGYGANTGIEDAHNLAWKLSSVLCGKSTQNLLDTYDMERRPIAWLRHQQIFARDDYKAHAVGASENVTIIDDKAMEFGQLYRSTAVLGADNFLQPALRPEQWAGQPGTRAPHLWLTVDSKQLSTLDLFQHDWVLLCEDERWIVAAAHAGKVLGITLKCLRMCLDAHPSNPETFRTAFGLGATGASLIRPDGYIAWRSTDLPADSVHMLTEVFHRVSSAASLSSESTE